MPSPQGTVFCVKYVSHCRESLEKYFIFFYFSFENRISYETKEVLLHSISKLKKIFQNPPPH